MRGTDASRDISRDISRDTSRPRGTPSSSPTAVASPARAVETTAPSMRSAQVLRRVTINAIPWAYFTVDGDPTRHETVKTLQLAPGPHRIHFVNPVLELERTITLDVPSDRDVSHVERLTSRDRAD